MKAVNDLDFLSFFWVEAKAIGQRIKRDLPKGSIHYSNTLKEVNPNSSVKMFLVPYSKLGDSWGVQEILNRLGGDSETLKILADKINYMILEGRSNDVKPMLCSICSNNVKSLTKGKSKEDLKRYREFDKTYHAQYLGKGHFRWNHKTHTLNEAEIRITKKYFSL